MKALVLSLVITGCGVKTSPRSTIIETRPAIPFKEKPPLNVKNTIDPQQLEQNEKTGETKNGIPQP